MKYFLTLTLLALFIPGFTQENAPELNTEMDSLSYFLGLSLGFELQDPPFPANQDLILQGFTEAFRGAAPVSEEAARRTFQSLQAALQEAEARQASEAAQEAREAGFAWLAENGAREGVVTTTSGLQYEILVKGEGSMPADTSTVRVHYEGKLTDGTVFDSSYDRGEPISFPLNRVIRGWTEGLQLMPTGSTYMFYISPDLGYGERGTGPIPPNAVLIFKVDLLGIE
jgi:FKBP-type peptidyl-prolyl cis-trans isomerase